VCRRGATKRCWRIHLLYVVGAVAVEREEGHGFGLHFKVVAVGGVMVHGMIDGERHFRVEPILAA